MLAIEKVIRILNEEDYCLLKNSLESTRAHKFADLLSYYRSGEADSNLHEKLQVSKNAFNVLKSRLYEKLQKHLINTGEVTTDSLFIQAINIPDLIFKVDRDLAITILEGLEKEMRELDLPEYLTVIHGAQKKLYFNTSKYYHYSKLYNRSVAFQLALNKAEEEIYGYTQVLGKYYLSGNKSLIRNLSIYKQEIEQIARLNESPRFRLFQNLIRASIVVHLPDTDGIDEINVDSLLKETKEIINKLPGNVFTVYYSKAIDSLLFVFFCKSGLFHHASEHLLNSVNDTVELVNFSNIVCIIPYLDQRIAYAIRKKEHLPVFDIDIDNIIGKEQEDALPYVAILRYNMMAYLVREDYSMAYHCAKILFNSVSFKGMPVLEIEIKCFFMILSLVLDKEVSLDAIISSVNRKIRESELEECDKERANILVKMIRIKAAGNTKPGDTKLETCFAFFMHTNCFSLNILHKLFTHEPFKNLFLR